MENQVKTSTENKEQQLKKLSKMTMIRSLLPIAGLIIIFLMFNALTNFRMMNNLPLLLSQVYVTMISATGVFFIMTMGGLDFSQGSILGMHRLLSAWFPRPAFHWRLWQVSRLVQRSAPSTVTSMYTARLNPSSLRFVRCSYSVDLSNI